MPGAELGDFFLVLEGEFRTRLDATLRKSLTTLGVDVDLGHGRPRAHTIIVGKIGIEVREIFRRHPREFDLRRAEILEVTGKRRAHRHASGRHATSVDAPCLAGKGCLMARKSIEPDTS